MKSSARKRDRERESLIHEVRAFSLVEEQVSGRVNHWLDPDEMTSLFAATSQVITIKWTGKPHGLMATSKAL